MKTARYLGSMVGGIDYTLLHSGIFGNRATRIGDDDDVPQEDGECQYPRQQGRILEN